MSNHANTMRALRGDAAWSGVLAFDEMQGAILVRKPIPVQGQSPARSGFTPRALTEDDISAAQEWLQIAGLRSSGRDTVHHAMMARARECAFHPVRDWLTGLRWDGHERLETWLTECLGADSDDYIRAIGRMFMIAMVARVCRPGCKVDHMPVLEGEQGIRKSSACAILGGPWFSDAMPGDVTAKDASQHLRGKWLIEFGEMHALTRSETTALKAFVTRRTEIYRPPYDRTEVAEPRQCVFVGTTNRSVYLRDDTGGRRFWPVRVGDVRLDRLMDIRDQLFAEALVRFREGEPWWPDPVFERRWIQPEQEDRLECEAWDELVVNYLHERARVTALDVARNALGIETPRIGRSETNRITAILERAGWRRGRRDGGSRWWVPGRRSDEPAS